MSITKISPSVVDFDAGITISTADNLDTLTLTSTDADANAGPNLRLYRNSGSPADSDVLGLIEFEGRNDNSQDVVYSTVDSRLVDASDGTEDGSLELTTIVAGSQVSRGFMGAAETVVNDNSIDINFRVESNGKQYMLFVDGGNDVVGIGTSVPASYNANADNVVIYDSTGHTGITIAGDTDDYGNIYFAQGTSGSDAYRGYIQYGHSATSDTSYRDVMLFGTATLERMRITSDGQINVSTGLMAIGTTSRTGGASSGNVTIEFAGNVANAIKTRDTTGSTNSNSMVMVNGSTAVGTISTTSSSTTYNTSSDYRLKENVNYNWDALTTLKQLKPAKFNFKVDADKTVEGFLAHEVSNLVPAAIKGEKDAKETRTKLVLDSDGVVIEEGVEEDAWTAGKENETYPEDSTWEASKEFPDYQQIDQSKLVPLMVKAIQELEAKVKALEEA